MGKKAVMYRLMYFDSRGRAELSRLIFALAGVEFEDDRIAGDKWMEIKPSTPFGSVPVLFIDEVPYAQSKSIARFLALEFKLAGDSLLEQLENDLFVDTIGDLSQPMMQIGWAIKDEKEKEIATKKLVEETMPHLLGCLEKRLKGKTFVAGNKISWGDLAIYDWSSNALKFDPDAFKNFPKLANIVQKVAEDPKIAAWLERRPQTDY